MDSLFDFERATEPEPQANAIIPRATVHDMVKRRAVALEAFAKLHTAMQAANVAFDAASTAHRLIDQRGREKDAYLDLTREEERHFLKRREVPKLPDYLATARKIVDRRMWSVLIELTELEKIMDKQAKDELRRDLMDNVPEATADNIFATLATFATDAQMIWRRGVANCFSNLDRRFRSHDGWKIGSRIILSYCFDELGHWRYQSNQQDTLFDIERAFSVLDGDGAQGSYGIAQAVEMGRRGTYGARQSEHDTQYFKIRCYKNGNAHLWFKRDDLVEKVNKLLGEYYGAPIPEEREPEEDPFANPKTALAKNYGFYPTPDDAADRLIEAASLYRPNDKPPLLVLEPSAGTGNLVRKLLKKDARVDCVEVHPDRAESLYPLARSVKCADFLAVEPTPIYDRVVMNPPFDRERDIDHVMHALKFLNPQGCLVAIMSAGTEFRETKKSVAFRELMATLKADFSDLPAGSFASVGTYCNTVILKVWKDGRHARW